MLLAYDVTPFEQLHYKDGTLVCIYIGFVLVMSLLLSFFYSVIDSILYSKFIKQKSAGYFFNVGIAVQTTLLLLIIWNSDVMIHYLIATISGNESTHLADEESTTWIIFLIFSLSLSRLIISVDRKLGPGNLWKLHSGKFHNPREEHRIFMFIDLKGGTTIAEKIGHIKYSSLLQDCFSDLSIVDEYNAEIYQYVGDEVVISWPVSEASNYQRFLTAYFAFQGALEKRRSHYELAYGAFPQFKAGAHAGVAVVTEVGEIKREITYHGDTLNTASRIQGMCNVFDAEMLISESLYEIIKPYSEYTLTDVGCISLKGKKNEVRLFKATL